jgi:hypothetical protein
MRLKATITIGAIGLVFAGLSQNLDAAYITIFGCIILYKIRQMEFSLNERRSTSLPEEPKTSPEVFRNITLQDLRLKKREERLSSAEVLEATARNEKPLS